MNESNTAESWEMPTPTTVLECIEHWRDLDLCTVPEEYLDATMLAIRDQIGRFLVTRRSGSFSTLWRVQRFDKRDWSSIRALLYPPATHAKSGRCNREGEPTLYAASRGETAFDELGFRGGEDYVLVRYRTSRINLSRIFGSFKPTGQAKKAILQGENLVSYQILREFLRSEFMRPVGEGTEFLYRISAAICKHWSDGDHNHGWLFPSVRSNGGENIALKASAVDLSATIVSAERGIVSSMEVAEFPKIGLVNGVSLSRSFEARISGESVHWVPSEGRRNFYRVRVPSNQ